MHLINKPLTFYFCTALFCHVILFSALSNGWKKSAEVSAQTNSITSYIMYLPLQKALSHKPGNILPPLQKGAASVASRGIVGTKLQRRKHSNQKTPTLNPPEFAKLTRPPFAKGNKENQSSIIATQGHSKLLTLLHNTIEQHQQYPLNAILAQQSGTAVVGFTLLPNGNIINSTLQQSSGYAELDQAALEAVQAISPFKTMTVKLEQHFNVAVSFTIV